MEQIGRIGTRKIYYVQIRNNSEWKNTLPEKDWIAFTIANNEDQELVPPMVKKCIDKNVSYTCSAGKYAQMTEEFFDEEISWRRVEDEVKSKNEFDYEFSLVTTSHRNFGKGFWFAATLANGNKFEIDKIICIDLTKRKVKTHLKELIEKINSGWLPSDNEIELAQYDK